MNDSSNTRVSQQQMPNEVRADDEGGLRAPPGLTGWRKAWWWFDFIILVKLARLRFIAVLVAIGAVITQWDTLIAYYDKWTRPAETGQAASGGSEWFCPMHPTVIRDNSREKCPICFMPLSKRKKGTQSEVTLPAGVVNRVQLSPYRIVLGGIGTTRVDYRPLNKEITAVGFVEFNERDQRTVAARVKGRIDKLFVNETGRMVHAGDDLAYVYSPELNVTLQNLLDARRNKSRENEASALRRLELLGIGEDQIHGATQADGKAETHIAIRSPISGHVINKYVKEGQYVDEGMPLFDIVDLSSVWIQAQVYEDDMAFLPSLKDIHAGGELPPVPVTAIARAYPDEVFHGILSFIYPHVDQATRTVTVRFEVENRDYLLKPGSTMSVTIHISPHDISAIAKAAARDGGEEMLSKGDVLAVPESAVIDTGSQKIVYRETAPGTYEGVKVALGKRMVDPEGIVFYPVLGGLHAGEQIVTAGSFLVDAETRLNPAAGSIYFGGSGGGSKSSTTVSTVRPSTPDDDDTKIDAGLAGLSTEDRALAGTQRFCPVLPDSRLGSMGVPVRLVIEGQTVFVCCEGCKKSAFRKPKQTLKKVEELKSKSDDPPVESGGQASEVESADSEADILEALSELPAEDRRLAEHQRYCVVMTSNRLGVMGPPVKLTIKGRPVFLCCESCKDEALEKPEEALQKLERLRQAVGQKFRLSR